MRGCGGILTVSELFPFNYWIEGWMRPRADMNALEKRTIYGYLGEMIQAFEMGGTCGAYGGGERCAQGSGGKT
jgi:hypothetical protein